MIYIKKISLSGFKSFSSLNPQQVEFLSGLNCIVGPNGSGKSNLFDAICLALTLDIKNFRVSSSKDLICSLGLQTESMASIKMVIAGVAPHNQGQTKNKRAEEKNHEICVQIRRHDSQPNSVKGVSSTQQTKTCYMLNGRTISMRALRKFLSSIGVRVHGNSSSAGSQSNHVLPAGFVILQNTVTTLMMRSPIEIASFITDASGALQFFDCVKKSQNQIQVAQSVQQSIKSSIDMLASSMMGDKLLLDQWKHVNQLMLEIKEYEDAIVDIDAQHLTASIQEKISQVALIEQHLRAIINQETELKERKSNLARELQENKLELESYGEESDCTQQLEEKKREKSSVQRKIKSAQSHQSEYRELQTKRKQLVDEKESLIVRKGKLDQALAQTLHSGELRDPMEQLNERWKVSDQALHSTKESLRKEQLVFDAKSLELKDLTTKLAQYQQQFEKRKKQDMDESEVKMKLLNNHAKTLECKTKLEDVKEEMAAIEKQVFHSREFNNLKGVLGPVGLLFSVPDESMQLPLSIISKRFERAIVVESSSHIAPILEVAKQRHKSVTIWPLDTLDITQTQHFEKQVRAIQSSDSHCSKMIFDPIKHVTPLVDNVHNALVKCFSGLVITENEQVSQYLIQRYRMSSVTKAGNLYRPGSITGGHQPHNKTLFQMKDQLAVLNRNMDEMQREMGELHNEKIHLNEQLKFLGKLNSLQDAITLLLERKDYLDEELSVSSSHMASLSSKVKLLESEVEVLSLKLAQHDESPEGSKEQIVDRLAQIDQTIEQNMKQIEEIDDLLEVIDDRTSNLEALKQLEQQLEQSIGELAKRVAEWDLKSERIAELEEELEIVQKKLTSLVCSEKKQSKQLAELKKDVMKLESKQKKMSSTTRENAFAISAGTSKEELQLRIDKLKKKQSNLSQHLSPVDQSRIQQKQNELAELELKYNQVQSSMEQLVRGIQEATVIVDQYNMKAFEFINQQFSKYFRTVVPLKVATLEKLGDKIEQGIQFVVYNENDTSIPVELSQLSGGQKTLLSLCFMLSVASYSKAPFYLMDEIDAALDEENQKVSVRLIQQVLSDGVQILSISHNHSFQSEALRTVYVAKNMDNNFSEITKVVTHRTTAALANKLKK